MAMEMPVNTIQALQWEMPLQVRHTNFSYLNYSEKTDKQNIIPGEKGEDTYIAFQYGRGRIIYHLPCWETPEYNNFVSNLPDQSFIFVAVVCDNVVYLDPDSRYAYPSSRLFVKNIGYYALEKEEHISFRVGDQDVEVVSLPAYIDSIREEIFRCFNEKYELLEVPKLTEMQKSRYNQFIPSNMFCHNHTSAYNSLITFDFGYIGTDNAVQIICGLHSVNNPHLA